MKKVLNGLISTLGLLTVTAVTLFSVTPASATQVKVVRNCVAYNYDTGARVNGMARFGMHTVVDYYTATDGTRMATLRVWVPELRRVGFLSIPTGCLESTAQGVVEYL